MISPSSVQAVISSSAGNHARARAYASALEGMEMRANFKARRAAQYAPALRRIQARGITVNGCFILGLDEHGPELLRFVVIGSHYRSPLDFSDETLTAARKGMQTFYRLFERIGRITGRWLHLQQGLNRLGQFAKAQFTRSSVDATQRWSEGFITCTIGAAG